MPNRSSVNNGIKLCNLNVLNWVFFFTRFNLKITELGRNLFYCFFFLLISNPDRINSQINLINKSFLVFPFIDLSD